MSTTEVDRVEFDNPSYKKKDASHFRVDVCCQTVGKKQLISLAQRMWAWRAGGRRASGPRSRTRTWPIHSDYLYYIHGGMGGMSWRFCRSALADCEANLCSSYVCWISRDLL